MPQRHNSGVVIQLHAFLTSVLDRDGRSALHSSHFTPKEITLCKQVHFHGVVLGAFSTHCIGNWLGPRASLDVVMKETLPLPRTKAL